MIGELGPRDPRGCSATVEVTTLAVGDNVVAKEVIFDCNRRCGIFERREKIGTDVQVDAEISSFVRSAVKFGCLNLKNLNESSGDIPSGFLPPVTNL